MQRANAEVGSAHALLLGVNVTQMSVAIVGLGNEFLYVYFIDFGHSLHVIYCKKKMFAILSHYVMGFVMELIELFESCTYFQFELQSCVGFPVDILSI